MATAISPPFVYTFWSLSTLFPVKNGRAIKAKEPTIISGRETHEPLSSGQVYNYGKQYLTSAGSYRVATLVDI
jgi:hypothetical protein